MVVAVTPVPSTVDSTCGVVLDVPAAPLPVLAPLPLLPHAASVTAIAVRITPILRR
jgi:hypothetical protein